jgi:hypothetical protein
MMPSPPDDAERQKYSARRGRNRRAPKNMNVGTQTSTGKRSRELGTLNKQMVFATHIAKRNVTIYQTLSAIAICEKRYLKGFWAKKRVAASCVYETKKDGR